MAAPRGSTFRPSAALVEHVAKVRSALGSSKLNVAVVGGGRSGRAAAQLLRAKGQSPSILDDRASDPADELALEKLERSRIDAADLVVLSPGVPREHPALRGALDRTVGELELASWFVTAPLLGVTGTNGKSTTTALAGHLLATSKLRAFVGGNLGRPLCELAASGEAVDVAVVELSSYQLEALVTARFEVACWLNLTPDHTDRYADVETYARAKERILELRSPTGIGVMNAEDETCVRAAERAGGRIRWFSTRNDDERTNAAGTHFFAGSLHTRSNGDVFEIELRNDRLPGRHNASNAAAALECARVFGASIDGLREGISSFLGLPHRIELVGTIGGARYLNDSKATNIDSVMTAVNAVDGPKVLIVGGRDKGAPWDPLVELSSSRDVKHVLAIGEATPIAVRAFSGRIPIEEKGDLGNALMRARELAGPGWSVLLSPACSSFDQFKNYEERGDTMRRLVLEMEGNDGRGR